MLRISYPQISADTINLGPCYKLERCKLSSGHIKLYFLSKHYKRSIGRKFNQIKIKLHDDD